MPAASRAMKQGADAVFGPFFMVLYQGSDMNDLDEIRQELLAAVDAASNRAALEQARVAALGRKGRITELMKGLGGLAADARKTAGATLNRLKDEIAAAIE